MGIADTFLKAAQSFNPQSIISPDSGLFGNAFKSLLNNSEQIGSLTSGLGSIYSAYNSNKLGNSQTDIAKQQNNLLLEDYADQKKRRTKQDNAFANVWG
jgi:hypothetical protein